MPKEITLEIRQKIFSLYWDQRNLGTIGWPTFGDYSEDGYCYLCVRPETINNDNFLSVKPLSSITDEDASVIGRYRYKDPKSLTHSQIGKSLILSILESKNNHKDYLESFEADYLRSKGYAIPYLDFTVEELIEAGVFKLKKV